jgi:hypothetical protein
MRRTAALSLFVVLAAGVSSAPGASAVPAAGGTQVGAAFTVGRIASVGAEVTRKRLVVTTRYAVVYPDLAEVDLRIDTKKARKGSEFAVFGTSRQIFRTDSNGFITSPVRCSGLRYRELPETRYAGRRIIVPRSCLKSPSGAKPAQVRIRVENTWGCNTVAYAPGAAKFSSWMRVGDDWRTTRSVSVDQGGGC